MTLTKPLLVLFSVISLSCQSQKEGTRIEISQPTAEQEATSIWRTINDISFFEQQGYIIHLPQAPLIDSLIKKSKDGTFGNDDYSAIYTLVETQVFDQKQYAPAQEKVNEQIDLLNRMIDQIAAEKSQWDWPFKLFDQYKVIFSLYGTGGSYDPDEGTITLLTNPEGEFMKYQNPAYTIIHEITHMGMEYSLVRKYNLSHGLKERLVDTFVWLMFQSQLPDYQIQNMGDKTIDQHLNRKADIVLLDRIVSDFKGK